MHCPPMSLRLLGCLVAACVSVHLIGSDARAAESFELKDGDRVLFIGNTLIERAGKYGYLEAALSRRWPERRIVFRNLGWAGDNVRARSRDYFDKKGDGYRRLTGHVKRLKPTVIFLAYGGNEARRGPEKLEWFLTNYRHLLGHLEKTGARIVLLSPIYQETLPPPLPNPTAHNKNLEIYSKAIGKLAADRKHTFVDLFTKLRSTDKPLTYNGLHLDANGYQQLAKTVLAELGLGKVSLTGSDALREAIVAKNQLYFYRWRPQNETYIFGHRRREQGRNAVEMPQFDPLVEKMEKQIAELLAKKGGA